MSDENLISQEKVDILLSLDPDGDFFKELLDVYKKQSPPLIKVLKEALEKNDASSIYQAAHKLKGSSLNLGAMVLSETCLEIELKGKNQDFSDLNNLIPKAEKIYNDSIASLDAITKNL